MERLFSPCTRLFDLLESQGHVPPEELLELNLEVSSDEFLSAERALSYADLYAMLGNGETIAWLTPDAVVMRAYGKGAMAMYPSLLLQDNYKFRINVDGKEIYALAHSLEHRLEICDVILRLLAASVVHSVILHLWNFREISLINAPTLAYLMEKCQSLKVLALTELSMDKNHCRVLGAYSRPGLEIVLNSCKLTDTGTSALAEVLGRNQGPTKILNCDFDNFVLADGLRGDSRLKSLAPRFPNNRDVGNRQVLAIADAVRENKGLVELDLGFTHRVSEETWGAICDSLQTHPTLEVFTLPANYIDATMTPAAVTSRIQALVDMLKVNTSIHTIRLCGHHSEHELFRGSVIPYLETNRLRPSLRAIQKTRPMPYRAKVLGRALLAVRTDPNRFWMLLSGNPEVAFPSTTATTAVPANLPTPASAASTSTTHVTDAVAASAMSAWTTTDGGD
jgi:hypothetical protein